MALTVFDDRGDVFNQAGVRMSLSLACKVASDHAAAIDHLLRALDLYQQINSSNGIARTLWRLSELHVLRGEPDLAERSLHNALALCDSLTQERLHTEITSALTAFRA